MKTFLLILAPFLIQAQPIQQNLQYYNPSLGYSYFEGSFNTINEFIKTVPVKSDTIKNFTSDIGTRTENFAIKFDGFINLPDSGLYTFFLSSDDGSCLYIDSAIVANNDGVHAIRERSGTKYLSAGLHSIQVLFFQKLGGIGLSVSYSGPGIAKQFVSDSVLFHADTSLFYMPTRYLLTDTLKDSAGNALTTKHPIMIEGYEVYKNVPGASYLMLIDRLDLQKNKLPKTFFVWLSK